VTGFGNSIFCQDKLPVPPLESQSQKYISKKEPYFIIVFLTRKMISGGKTFILCADSACSINCLMISGEVVPVISKEQSIPRSLHVNETII
jgi:hypothetical protein